MESLIDFTVRQWMEDQIRNIFDPGEAQAILSIPLGSGDKEDRRICRFTKNSFFTVKSAYHIEVRKFSRAHNFQTSGSSTPMGWKKIWDIKAMPKVHVFLWRVCSDALPIKVNLMRRGGKDDTICTLCGEASETIDMVWK